jgi:hypothetical protein
MVFQLTGRDDDEDDSYVLTVSVSAETLRLTAELLEGTDIPEMLSMAVRRELQNYELYPDYTPRFTKSIASSVAMLASTQSITKLFATDGASYLSASRSFTVAYLQGLKRAYEDDPDVDEETVESVTEMIEMMDTGSVELGLDAGSVADANGVGFDAHDLDPDENPFAPSGMDTEDNEASTDEADDADDTDIEETVGEVTARSRQLDKDPETGVVSVDEDISESDVRFDRDDDTDDTSTASDDTDDDE